MNMDKKSHNILTLVMYINFICSYFVVLFFNENPLLPFLFLTIILIIQSISHYYYYSHESINNKAKTIVVFQTLLVFILLYFDQSTYELLFLFLPLGDSIFAFPYKFSVIHTTTTLLIFFPFNIYIHERTMGFPYVDVMARDVVVLIFFLFIIYISKMQIVEKMKYNKVLNERNLAFEKLQTYSEKIEASAVHEERSRIAYMLHNSIGHMLVSINLSLQAEKMTLIRKGLIKSTTFSAVEKQIKDAMSLLRMTIENSDDFISKLEIRQLIDMLISNLQNNISIDITYLIDEKIKTPKKFNNLIYNVVLESVTNSLKHSNCNNITVTIKSNACISITIKDDGVGFDNIFYGFGISKLIEKIENLNGRYKIFTNDGCTVEVVLPLEEI